MAGRHRQEDADKKRPVGEEQKKITPEQRKKAVEPIKPEKHKGQHRA